MAQNTDRREHPRQSIERPCKVFRRGTQQYVAARTCDVSAGGALLEISAARPVVPGERVDVGVAWSRSPILLEDALMESHVVRVSPMGKNRQTIGIRFDRAISPAVAA
jgi:hypothetical protein